MKTYTYYIEILNGQKAGNCIEKLKKDSRTKYWVLISPKQRNWKIKMVLCLNFFRFNIGFEGLGLSQNGKMVEGKKVVFNKILGHKNQIN